MTKGDDTRSTILERAFELAARLGLEGLTIGELANDLGMSKSGLFAHFKSKEALQLAVIDHSADRFVERVIKPTLKSPRGEPRVRAMLETWLGWVEREARQGGCFFAAAAFELDDRPGVVRDHIAQTSRKLHDFIGTVVKTGIVTRDFADDMDVDQFVFDFHSVMLGAQLSFRLLGDRRAHKKAQRAVEALIAGVRPAKSAAKPAP